jgi:hypothetical protein
MGRHGKEIDEELNALPGEGWRDSLTSFAGNIHFTLLPREMVEGECLEVLESNFSVLIQ